MSKKTPSTNLTTTAFFENVASLIEQARSFVGRTANLTMCQTYYEIGRMIVEEEQGGSARAQYGRSLLKELSRFLSVRVGKGFSETNLKNARKFYLVYSPSIRQTMPAELKEGAASQIWQALPAKSEFSQLWASQHFPFTLSWSHYLILMRIEDEHERRFYEIEVTRQQWTYRQLQRQYNASLYERLALSRDKHEVLKLSCEGQTIEKPKDILKNPLVLEFLDLDEKAIYSESDLENFIINKLSQFLLELGKGFLFEARQKRFSFDEDHFIVDLVFYNRLLQCYLLIDLKTEKQKHQDLGQMQMYVNYFDRYVKTNNERPTIGMLLCKEKNDNMVELTLPKEANIYASAYSLYLPDKALLQRKLAEWAREYEESQGTEYK